MKRNLLVSCLVVLVVLVAVVFVFPQQFQVLKAWLVGYAEVPAVSSAATGQFRAEISKDESSITYELSYADLEGAVLQSHIHFGRPGTVGGVSVWLCSNLASPPTPAGTQPCPAAPATITGTITAANVVGPTNQGIAPGEFAELVRAMRAGSTYVNVHTTKFPGGELRNLIEPGGGGPHH